MLNKMQVVLLLLILFTCTNQLLIIQAPRVPHSLLQKSTITKPVDGDHHDEVQLGGGDHSEESKVLVKQLDTTTTTTSTVDGEEEDDDDEDDDLNCKFTSLATRKELKEEAKALKEEIGETPLDAAQLQEGDSSTTTKFDIMSSRLVQQSTNEKIDNLNQGDLKKYSKLRLKLFNKLLKILWSTKSKHIKRKQKIEKTFGVSGGDATTTTTSDTTSTTTSKTLLLSNIEKAVKRLFSNDVIIKRLEQELLNPDSVIYKLYKPEDREYILQGIELDKKLKVEQQQQDDKKLLLLSKRNSARRHNRYIVVYRERTAPDRVFRRTFNAIGIIGIILLMIFFGPAILLYIIFWFLVYCVLSILFCGCF